MTERQSFVYLMTAMLVGGSLALVGIVVSGYEMRRDSVLPSVYHRSAYTPQPESSPQPSSESVLDPEPEPIVPRAEPGSAYLALDGVLNSQVIGERRARYDRLTPEEQQAFVLAAASYVDRYHLDCQDWWRRSTLMDDESFLHDDTLGRLRVQLGRDLENLLPSR